MLTNSLDSFLFYLNHFELVDYGAYIWFLFLAFLFLVFSIALMRRYILLGFFVLLIALSIFIAGPFTIKWFLNSSLRKNEVQIGLVKQLQFSDTLILEGNISNLSKKSFSTCRIYFGFLKQSKNRYKQIANELIPYQKRLFTIEQPILKNEIADFRVVLDNFRLQEDINISAKSECY